MHEHIPPSFLHGFLTVAGTVAAAVYTVLAMGPYWAFEVLALNSPSPAGTALGTPTGDPRLAFL